MQEYVNVNQNYFVKVFRMGLYLCTRNQTIRIGDVFHIQH